MRDLLLLAILFSFILVNFRLPYFMALGYLWIDFLQPQRLGYYVFNQIPVAMILGAGAFLSFLFLDKEKKFRFSALQTLVVLLVGYMTMSTYGWMVVPDGAVKLDWVTKALLFSAFIPLVLTTRVRIEAALAVILFSISAITLSAGGKVLMGGGGYGSSLFLVNNNTGLYEGSTLATTSLAIVPLLWWFYKYNSFIKPSKVTFLAALGITLSMVLVTIGAEARTGLVAMAALAGFVWLRSKNKMISATALVLVALISIPFLPQSFTDRMSTLEAVQSDQSASTRLAVWDWTLGYVAANPLGGGFNVYKINNVTIDMSKTTGEAGNTDTTSYSVQDRARAFHSSYFEMLGEQGIPGFLLWISIVVLVWIRSRNLVKTERKLQKTEPEDSPLLKESEWFRTFGTAMSTTIPVYMTGSLFVGIALQPAFYHFVALTVAMTYLRSDQIAAARNVPVIVKRAKPGARNQNTKLRPGALPAE
ncbi:DUF5935 domain-containing protein [Pacificimonas sp. ICDLI1SI03]